MCIKANELVETYVHVQKNDSISTRKPLGCRERTVLSPRLHIDLIPDYIIVAVVSNISPQYCPLVQTQTQTQRSGPTALTFTLVLSRSRN